MRCEAESAARAGAFDPSHPVYAPDSLGSMVVEAAGVSPIFVEAAAAEEEEEAEAAVADAAAAIMAALTPTRHDRRWRTRQRRSWRH